VKDKRLFYLQFVDRSKRIALAPSIAVEEIPEASKNSFIEGVCGFDKLSVREKQGGELIKRLTGKEAEVLIDPTMALTAAEWEDALALEEKKAEEKYILLYFLGEVSDAWMTSVRKYADQNGYRIVSAYIKDGLGQHNSFGPGQFVDLIRNAEFVFTDSFHGVAFSMIFNRSFYAFPRWNSRQDGNVRTKSRILSILEKMGLEERMCEAFPEEILTIDYEKTNRLMNAERTRFSQYIRNALR